MTSIKSYAALPRDMSADRVSDRYCDRLTDLAGNGGRSAFFAAGDANSSADPRLYQPNTAPTQYMAGGSPRAGVTTSMPYAISAFCLRERDASHASLHALTRNPVSAAAAASENTALVRSRSVDQEFMSRSGPHPSPPRSAGGGVRSSRQDSLIIDLQSRVGALSRECCALRVELERTRDRLHASTHSVRAFWSPELKRERALRKDESARLAIVTERLRILLRTSGQVIRALCRLWCKTRFSAEDLPQWHRGIVIGRPN